MFFRESRCSVPAAVLTPFQSQMFTLCLASHAWNGSEEEENGPLAFHGEELLPEKHSALLPLSYATGYC